MAEWKRNARFPDLMSQVFSEWESLRGGVEGVAGSLGVDGVISSNSKAFRKGTFSQVSEETKMGNKSCLLDF